jgi:hypothetical protein
MKEYGLANFMVSDNISYNPADHNYNIAKYLPFGPVKDDAVLNSSCRGKHLSGRTN